MKKRLIFALSMAIMISLAGCGAAPAKQNSSSSLPESGVSSQESESSVTESISSQENLESNTPQDNSHVEESSQPQASQNHVSSEENVQPKPPETTSSEIPQEDETSSEETVMNLNVTIGTSTFTATLEDNAAVDAFVEMMRKAPVVIQMSDYSGFEKVGSLGTSLPSSNSQTTTQSGDIVLYNGNQIVIFYGSNSWSYTRLGKINDLTGWEEALGSGDVTVTFLIGE